MQGSGCFLFNAHCLSHTSAQLLNVNGMEKHDINTLAHLNDMEKHETNTLLQLKSNINHCYNAQTYLE